MSLIYRFPAGQFGATDEVAAEIRLDTSTRKYVVVETRNGQPEGEPTPLSTYLADHPELREEVMRAIDALRTALG